MTPFVDLHTHKLSSEDNVVSVVNLSADVSPCGEGFFSIGIHPWSLDDAAFDEEKAFAEIERKVAGNRIVAIGETGLDRMHKATMDRQTSLFKRHVALSEHYELPLIIHNVRCTAELVSLRKQLKPRQKWIVHGFAGNVEEAEQLISQGFALSVGAALLDDRRKISKALKDIDLSFVFFETDTSEMSIREIYARAAELLAVPVESLKDSVYKRFKKLCPFQ